MWKRVSSWFQTQAVAQPELPRILNFEVGDTIAFTQEASIPELRGQRASIVRKRIYQFADDTIQTYVIKSERGQDYGFSITEDDHIGYLSVSRELSTAERRAWFDPDALSFFLEKTTAQTLRCRAKSPPDAPWAAERYTKSVDLIPGVISEPGKRGGGPFNFTYSMLLDAASERAIEIEQYTEHGIIRMFATVFMPISTLSTELHPALRHEPAVSKPAPAPQEEPPLFLEDAAPIEADTHVHSAQIIPLHDAFAALTHELQAMEDDEVDDVPLFAEEPPKKIFKNDFRRLDVREADRAPAWDSVDNTPVPDFLLKPRDEAGDKPDQLFKKIFEPKHNQIACDNESAELLENEAKRHGVSVQEMIRTVVGLTQQEPATTMIDLPLSEDDYKALAMRYQIRPDKKDEIRKRMSEELSHAISQLPRK